MTLIERLRSIPDYVWGMGLGKEAADEIERLQRENEELRKDATALAAFIRMLDGHVLSRALFDEAIDQAMKGE